MIKQLLFNHFSLFIFSLILTIVTLLVPTTSILADGTNPTCPSIYGVACPSGQLSLDKKIQNPKNGEWVETLNANDITFISNQEVSFRVEVKNTGSTNLTNVSVKDQLPDFVIFTSGTGSFDTNTKTLSWTIDNLNAGEFKQFFIKAKVKSQSELPQATITCLTNFSQASKDNLQAQDTAGFCLQTPVLTKVLPAPAKVAPVEELPKTGLPLIAWGLAGLLPIGLKLRKTGNQGQNSDSALFTWQKREFRKES